MPPLDPAAEEILAKMAAESAARIAQADQECHDAQIAFAAGHFEELFRARCEAATRRILDEYDRQNAAGGNGEESG